ncbi:DUF4267 domain-containing protein [Microvirga roseola]|uniref:DUF4267 domain-containing protein n=1 Tax=Microvirga roseola TaxID=2883126 RepID=UPI001E3EA124|nr:DUF4267 domain-containing protein [Microvirga roseola]
MTSGSERRGLPPREPSTWLVWLLAATFVGLGVLFVLAPGLGALVFGLPAPEGTSFGYLPAIGLRDLAFGIYLLILSLTATRRIVGLIFGATVLIPIGDMTIIAVERGLEAAGYLLLHGFSGATMLAASIWLLVRSKHDNMGGMPS